MLVAVAGCVAQAEGAEMVARAPVVDMVVGPQSYHRLPEMIAQRARAGGHVLETDFPALEKFDALPQAVSRYRRQRLSHRAGRLRQILHLLRRALYPRAGTFAQPGSDPGRSARAGGARRARDRAAGPERQRLSRPGRKRQRLELWRG